MFEKFKKWYLDRVVNKGLKVGDLLEKDKDNPFENTIICITDVERGYVQYKFLVIDGSPMNTGCKYNGNISGLLWNYSKIKS